MSDRKVSLQYAQEFVDFLNETPTPYHAVCNVKRELKEAGFVELNERESWDEWKIQKGGKYYVTRNGSSIIAFTVGGKYCNGDGISIVGAHTDSPCLRMKPVSNFTQEGYIQVGVEQYGGLIAHTWFDRDLSIAGRVYVKDSVTGNFTPKLVKIDKPLLRIPTLAIHLSKDRQVPFDFNKESQLVPIAGQTSIEKKVEEEHGHSCKDDPNLKMTEEQFSSVTAVIKRHSKAIVDLVASECDVAPTQIEDFELILFDHQKSVLGGLNEEFVFSGRLDNLTSCFCATKGLIASSKKVDALRGIQLISLFDHEEIGSASAQGADSSFLPDILQRLTKIDIEGDGFKADRFHDTIAKSFLLSSDMAHGVNPNYSSCYEANNKPNVNGGPVVKVNANQRYATNSPGIVLIKNIASMAKISLQLFVVRNDFPCGSTIGPILASKLGMRTLDIGNPQLSMHSIRETGGSYDVKTLCDLFDHYFENYYAMDAKILCDRV